jgi:hypothetical protein
LLGIPVERTAAESETVKVGVRPAERTLQHLMENVETNVGAHVQASPDVRFGMLEIDTHAEDGSVAPARLPV